MRKQKIFSILLALCMVLTMLPVAVSAEDIANEPAPVEESTFDTEAVAEILEDIPEATTEETVSIPVEAEATEAETAVESAEATEEEFTARTPEAKSVSGYWEYTVSSGVATITAYNGSASTVTVPDAFGNYMVTAIGNSAFKNNTKVKTVNLPEKLLSIGRYAFEGCISLTSITLPEKLTTIDYHAFYNCTNVKTITVNSESIDNLSSDSHAFYCVGHNTSGVTVTFSSGCKRVPNYLFYEYSGENYAPYIKTVNLASTITEIGQCAFEGCSKMTSFTMSANVTKIGSYSFKGCVALTSITLPQELISIGYHAFYNCTNVKTITVNSESIDNLSSDSHAFYCVGHNTSGVTVTFASGCTHIPANLFYEYSGSKYAANLKEVTIADTVSSIGNYAFGDCTNLKNIKFLGDAPVFANYVFKNVTATARVPSGYNWPSSKMQDYGGDITWVVYASGKVATTPMYRLYNPNSGEHFYTGSTVEREDLVKAGWSYEGIGWYAPTNVGDPVYRLYNPYAGEHHYTTSVVERDSLVSIGWKYEGVGWLTASSNQVPVYRVYNPNEFANNHHYTTSIEERDFLIEIGWQDEGIGWYGIKK